MPDDSVPPAQPAPGERRLPDFREFTIPLEEAKSRVSDPPGVFEQLFLENEGRPADKWVHYLPVYDRAFAPFRGFPIRMLEIGVFKGGSLEMWRKYFGPEAVIFGIDIDPACAQRVDPPNQVRIGSQADPDFLRQVAAEMGGLEIVLDDGSHVASHQRASFKTLWPLLSPGGLYVIEDLHTAYWPKFEGGYGAPGTAVELVKDLIDDMHAWYHLDDEKQVRRDELGSLLIADSIVVIKKAARSYRPGRVVTGRQE